PSTVVSPPPQRTGPAGVNARAVVHSWWHLKRVRSVQVAVSQTRIVPSCEVVASDRPSGENVASGNSVGTAAIRLPVATSQTAPEVTSSRPLGENVQEEILPSSWRSSLPLATSHRRIVSGGSTRAIRR